MNLHQRTDTLTECDREAIHHIAAVQSFGGLLALDGEERVAHASANVAALLGLPQAQPPARRLPRSSPPRRSTRSGRLSRGWPEWMCWSAASALN